MSMPPPVPAGQWTVDMLSSIPDDGNRYEIIDGELFVSPAPSYAHQRIVVRLTALFFEYLRDSSTVEVIAAPADVRSGEKTSLQPDLFLIPFVDGEPVAGPARLRDVLLAIEVLSPSTAGFDRYKKRRAYLRQGVAEYWILDPEARFVERWLPDDRQPEIVRDGIAWTARGTDRPLEINLGLLFGSRHG
jgi:Uma2 family endonuclease